MQNPFSADKSGVQVHEISQHQRRRRSEGQERAQSCDPLRRRLPRRSKGSLDFPGSVQRPSFPSFGVDRRRRQSHHIRCPNCKIWQFRLFHDTITYALFIFRLRVSSRVGNFRWHRSGICRPFHTWTSCRKLDRFRTAHRS